MQEVAANTTWCSAGIPKFILAALSFLEEKGIFIFELKAVNT